MATMESVHYSLLSLAVINTRTKSNLGRKELFACLVVCFTPPLRDARARAPCGFLEAGAVAKTTEDATHWHRPVIT